LTANADLEARLIDTCLAVSRELALVGLVSFDFLIGAGEPALLEVNPRPGATLDVFEDGSGSLFSAHVEACLGGGDPADVLKSRWRPPAARAAAILYADRGPLTVEEVDWPPWSADRPRADTAVGRHQPIATVLAEASDIDAAELRCRERLGVLENLLYEGKVGKGALR
jgi:predicted ATP-grasp superfamily ATP-dependent carboligase